MSNGCYIARMKTNRGVVAKIFILVSGSAPIDAGADCGIEEDIEGNPRPFGTKPDVGAYEFGVVGIKQKKAQDYPGMHQNTIKVISGNGFVTVNYKAVDKNSIVSITIYDLFGSEIVQLPVQSLCKVSVWDGKSSKGKKCVSGCYLVTIKNSVQIITKHFVLCQRN